MEIKTTKKPIIILSVGPEWAEADNVWYEFFRLAAKSDRPMTGMTEDLQPIYTNCETAND